MQLPYVDDAIAMIEANKQAIIKVAQEVVDDWDWLWGGACDEIASKVAEFIEGAEGLYATPHSQDGADHSYVVVPVDSLVGKGLVVVDIPWFIYETKISWYAYEPTYQDIKPEHLLVYFVDVTPEDAGLEGV